MAIFNALLLLTIASSPFSEACMASSNDSAETRSSSSCTTSTVTGQMGTVYGHCGSYDDTGETQAMLQLRAGGGQRKSARNRIMPWLVFIAADSNNCTGIIVNDQWVATMQSCVGSASAITVSAGADVTFVTDSCSTTAMGMGSPRDVGHNGRSYSPGPKPLPPPRVEVAGIVPAFLDSRYDATSGAYDIALIKLSTPLDFTYPDIQPACLPESSDNCTSLCSVDATTGGMVYAHGWVPDEAATYGGMFGQMAVAFQSTIQACQVTTTTTSTVGDKASVLTVGHGTYRYRNYYAQYACYFPGRMGAMYTFACCVLDFITSTIANN